VADRRVRTRVDDGGLETATLGVRGAWGLEAAFGRGRRRSGASGGRRRSGVALGRGWAQRHSGRAGGAAMHRRVRPQGAALGGGLGAMAVGRADKRQQFE
jgi:hypothetical protein